MGQNSIGEKCVCRFKDLSGAFAIQTTPDFMSGGIDAPGVSDSAVFWVELLKGIMGVAWKGRRAHGFSLTGF